MEINGEGKVPFSVTTKYEMYDTVYLCCGASCGKLDIMKGWVRGITVRDDYEHKLETVLIVQFLGCGKPSEHSESSLYPSYEECYEGNREYWKEYLKEEDNEQTGNS